jgi:hypothetical protein
MAVAVEIGNLGDLAAERGDLARAADLLVEALEVSREIGSVYMLVNFLPSFAVLAIRARADEDGIRLLGAARALETTSGLAADPNSSIDEAADAARERLGEAVYAEVLSEGTRLSSDDAVGLALNVARRIRQGAQAPGA